LNLVRDNRMGYTAAMATRWHRGSWTVIALGLLGCAATGKALSPEAAREMSHLPIRAFLKERFVEAVHNLPGADTSKFVMKDGSVLMEALYTDVNMMQLDRPAIELERYCRAQGGTITRKTIDRASERSAVAAKLVQADEQRFCEEQAALGTTTVPDCRFAMARAHHMEGVAPARQTAAEAQQDIAPHDFGQFSCSHPHPLKHPDWVVVIEAIDYERGESGTLKSNSLMLLISPQPDTPPAP
jgi:hypothetical protein